MITLRRIFKLKHTLSDISRCVEEGINLTVTTEPVKTMADKYYVEKSFSRTVQDDYKQFCNSLAERSSYQSQRCFFLSQYLRHRLQTQINNKIYKAQDFIKIPWLVHAAQEDQQLNAMLNSDATGNLTEDELMKVFEQMNHVVLVRWVHNLGVSAMLAYMGSMLFSFSTSSDEYVRKFELLVDSHLDKLGAELVLKNDASMEELKSIYSFKETQLRYELLNRYCNSIEAGNFKDVETVGDEFVSALEMNYAKVKDAIK